MEKSIAIVCSSLLVVALLNAACSSNDNDTKQCAIASSGGSIQCECMAGQGASAGIIDEVRSPGGSGATPDALGRAGESAGSSSVGSGGASGAPSGAGTATGMSLATGGISLATFGGSLTTTADTAGAGGGTAGSSGTAGSLAMAGAAGSCLSGETPCNGHCVNLSKDTSNCGACGKACVSGQTCACCEPSNPYFCNNASAACWGTAVECASIVMCSDGAYHACALGAGDKIDCTTNACTTSCTESTNLLDSASHSPSGDWVGSDLTSSTDDPCGFQGIIHAWSDPGIDATYGTADDSLTFPTAPTPGTNSWNSPCTGGKCCIRGVTRLYPLNASGTPDYGAPVWGAGIGMTFLDMGFGKTLPYYGPALGLRITLTGKTSGQSISIGYVQQATDQEIRVVTFSALSTISIPFTAGTCPSWATGCVTPGKHPYGVLIKIAGGNVAGPFEVCLGSVTPILN